MKLYCYKSEDYGTWSALIKDLEDDSVKKYLALGFKKGNEPKGTKAAIEVEDSFFTVFSRKDGSVDLKLVVMKWHKA